MIFNYLKYLKPIWYYNLKPSKDYLYFCSSDKLSKSSFNIEPDNLFKELLFEKQGFSGYPNEAAEIQLVNKDFNLVKNLLGISFDRKYIDNCSQALEWKLMNVELFLDRFYGFI